MEKRYNPLPDMAPWEYESLKADIGRFNKDGKLRINPEARILRVDVQVSAPGQDKGFAIATLKTVAR